MRKSDTVPPALFCSLAALALGACQKHDFLLLPDRENSVNVRLNFGSTEWTVTVRNSFGSTSSTMFAANDHQRSNIYLTKNDQLVVIEQGGADVFFKLSKDSAPVALDADKYKERDTRSETWRYIGVIKDGKFIRSDRNEECISLLGEGVSPYRKQHQAQSF